MSPVPTHGAPSSPPAALRLPVMREHRRSLLRSWAPVYAIGACVLPSRDECWTACRLDASGVITASEWLTLGVLLREDHGGYPQRRKTAAPDYLLAQARREHPGFAVIEAPRGYLAFRGCQSWEAHEVRALGCILADVEAADARIAMRARR